MRTRGIGLAAVFLGATSLLFGQLDSNSIVITASRTTNLQPDQLLLAVSVNSNLNTGLDEIVGALQGSGTTAANLVSLYAAAAFVLPGAPPPPKLEWIFSLSVPLEQMKATIATLTNLQQTIARNNTGLSLAFSVQGSRVSPDGQSPDQCQPKDLISDAQAQAQKLAAAAGLTAGPIVAISDESLRISLLSPSVVPYVSQRIPYASQRSGAFSSLLGPINFGPAISTPFTCAIIVKFQLLRYQ